ncbi:hypothetical protein BB558_005939, partial [Smittium angustum]
MSDTSFLNPGDKTESRSDSANKGPEKRKSVPSKESSKATALFIAEYSEETQENLDITSSEDDNYSDSKKTRQLNSIGSKHVSKIQSKVSYKSSISKKKSTNVIDIENNYNSDLIESAIENSETSFDSQPTNSIDKVKKNSTFMYTSRKNRLKTINSMVIEMHSSSLTSDIPINDSILKRKSIDFREISPSDSVKKSKYSKSYKYSYISSDSEGENKTTYLGDENNKIDLDTPDKTFSGENLVESDLDESTKIDLENGSKITIIDSKELKSNNSYGNSRSLSIDLDDIFDNNQKKNEEDIFYIPFPTSPKKKSLLFDTSAKNSKNKSANSNNISADTIDLIESHIRNKSPENRSFIAINNNINTPEALTPENLIGTIRNPSPLKELEHDKEQVADDYIAEIDSGYINSSPVISQNEVCKPLTNTSNIDEHSDSSDSNPEYVLPLKKSNINLKKKPIPSPQQISFSDLMLKFSENSGFSRINTDLTKTISKIILKAMNEYYLINSYKQPWSESLFIATFNKFLHIFDNKTVTSSGLDRITLNSSWLSRFHNLNVPYLKSCFNSFPSNISSKSKSFKSQPYIYLNSESHFSRMLLSATSQYSKNNIFSVSVTGIFYRLLPNEILAKEMLEGDFCYMERLSTIMCVNASGTEKLPLWIVGAGVDVLSSFRSQIDITSTIESHK